VQNDKKGWTKRWRRSWWFVAVGVTVLWLAVWAVVGIAGGLSNEAMRQRVVDGLRAATRGHVELEGFSYSLSGEATLKGLVIENMSMEGLLIRRMEVDEATVEFHRPGALSTKIVIDAIRAGKVSLDVLELPAAERPAVEPEGGGGDDVTFNPELPLEVAQLSLSVRTRDLLGAERPFRVGGLKVALKIPAGKPIEVTVTGHDPIWGRIDTSGTLNPDTGRGNLRIRATDTNLTPEAMASLPFLGVELAKTISVRGSVSCEVALALDLAGGGPVVPTGYVEPMGLEVRMTQARHLPLTVRGRIDLTGDAYLLDLHGTGAEGTWKLRGRDAAAPDGHDDVTFEFKGFQLSDVLDPATVKQSQARGRVSGRAQIQGRLDDPKSWAGGGKIDLADMVAWKVPILDVIVSETRRFSIGQDDKGYGELKFEFKEGLVVNKGSKLVSPSVAIFSTGGTIDMDGDVDLDVVVAPRVVDIPVIGDLLKLTQKFFLNNLAKLVVYGPMDSPRAKVVPLDVVSKVTQLFLTDLWKKPVQR